MLRPPQCRGSLPEGCSAARGGRCGSSPAADSDLPTALAPPAMKTAVTIAVLAVLLVVALVAGLYLWWSLSDVEISLHGLIAMTLGCLVSLALGGGLMFLVFYSNRRGHDDEHHRGPKR
jgi:hypothetical protein